MTTIMTTLLDFGGGIVLPAQAGAPQSPKIGATRPCIAPAKAGHEVQQRQQVSQMARTFEAAVEEDNARATLWPSGPLRQQLQQPPQRQCQPAAVQSSRNGSQITGKRKTYKHLFEKLASYDNLLLAYQKAKKGKSKKPYVAQFGKHLKNNLYSLQWQLLTNSYRPGKLKVFTVRDPKTRKISASPFPDRVVHHAICNLLEPIFERRFIHDTMANRKGKGTKATLERFDTFMRRVAGHHGKGFALKADIRHYFDNVDQKTLLRILGRRVKDQKLLDLISVILANHKTLHKGKGMPLGNLTSQFFANIYLGELDHFVKHKLRAKFYVRYVDDFILLSPSREKLDGWQKQIDLFLHRELQLQLHPDKTKIIRLRAGVPLVGFRVFRHHKLLKKSNARRIWCRLAKFKERKTDQKTIRCSMAGWMGYAKMANTYRLRQRIMEASGNGP